jgi:hypothetical protein
MEQRTREDHESHVAQALVLQAKEVERRLEILNGSHERLAELTATFLRQETFEAWQKSVSDADDRLREADLTWKRGVDKQLSEQRGASNRTFALMAVALAALSLALRFWP